MTRYGTNRLLARFHGNVAADGASIRRTQNLANFQFPDDYVRFLQHSDGGEGFIGGAYVILWHVGELIEMNKAYQVEAYAPGLFVFGSDGGGEAYGFDTRTPSKSIVSVPFVGMDLSAVRTMAPNFEEFLERMYES